MNDIKLPSGRYLVAEVPKGSHDFKLNVELHFYTPGLNTRGWGIMKLPSGNWEVVGMANELSEYQCMGIVEMIYFPHGNWDEYKNYLGKENWGAASSSLKSLLSLHGMNPETTILLKDRYYRDRNEQLSPSEYVCKQLEKDLFWNPINPYTLPSHQSKPI